MMRSSPAGDVWANAAEEHVSAVTRIRKMTKFLGISPPNTEKVVCIYSNPVVKTAAKA
jgi:hypothetical protein